MTHFDPGLLYYLLAPLLLLLGSHLLKPIKEHFHLKLHRILRLWQEKALERRVEKFICQFGLWETTLARGSKQAAINMEISYWFFETIWRPLVEAQRLVGEAERFRYVFLQCVLWGAIFIAELIGVKTLIDLHLLSFGCLAIYGFGWIHPAVGLLSLDLIIYESKLLGPLLFLLTVTLFIVGAFVLWVKDRGFLLKSDKRADALERALRSFERESPYYFSLLS